MTSLRLILTQHPGQDTQFAVLIILHLCERNCQVAVFVSLSKKIPDKVHKRLFFCQRTIYFKMVHKIYFCCVLRWFIEFIFVVFYIFFKKIIGTSNWQSVYDSSLDQIDCKKCKSLKVSTFQVFIVCCIYLGLSGVFGIIANLIVIFLFMRFEKVP